MNALRVSGLSPNRLELEITETLLLSNTDATMAILKKLKAIGVSIVMDDFGTAHLEPELSLEISLRQDQD